MMARKAHPPRRHLSREELSLWIEVTRTVTPRPGVDLPIAPAAKEAAQPEPVQPRDEPLIAPPEPGKPHKGPYRPHPPLAPIERRLRQRLSRGQIEVDMKIDLHGMRQDEAHSALRGFLSRAKSNGAKVVLVVTGKGTGKPRLHDPHAGHWSEPGVLRRAVPQWLAAPDLRAVVLGFEEAAQGHGGSGALYVRLRGKAISGVRLP